MQLHLHGEAVAYLYQGGSARRNSSSTCAIGYAPGDGLQGRADAVGYSLQTLGQAGLVTGAGYDAYVRRIVFPLEANLFGRSLSAKRPLTVSCRAR
jgi:hypothetical protein